MRQQQRQEHPLTLLAAAVWLGTAALLLLFSFWVQPAAGARYYEQQQDFSESSVPKASYRWDKNNDGDPLQWCVWKEKGVANKYYVWTKMAVQDWRRALEEYTGSEGGWDMSVRYAPQKSGMAGDAGCDVRVYIYDTYKDFPGYPEQTGAYTAVKYTGGVAMGATVYLSPRVLHGDGKSEIDLPGYAFRSSAVHEAGHVLGLGHMNAEKGYLMSPLFDFWEQKDQLPITTLELSALAEVYGSGGFSAPQ